MAIKSLKTNEDNRRVPTTLFAMYLYMIRCPHLNNEELQENRFCSAIIPFTHTLPKVTDTLKYKGNLRISWSFDIEYNKNIDLIFFPEENPYINYAVLFAKDFEKSFDKNSSNRELSDITIPYDINYDFVREILSQSDLSVMQQERFFESRFGSVFIPMEIEFEWYYLSAVFGGYKYDEMTYPQHNKEASFSFLVYENIVGTIVDIEEEYAELCLGIIKSYQVLPKNTPLNFSDSIENWNYDSIEGSFSYTEIFSPLPTAALALTQTNIGDYLVNVRDKPDSKEGKIVAQLLTQKIRIPENLYINDGYSDIINPLYQEMVDKGREWYREDNESSIDDDTSALEYYHHKTRQLYFKKEKGNLIHPLNFNEYLILVWNIEPNNWAKVWILRVPDKKNINSEGETFESLRENYDIEYSIKRIISSYSQTFLESPSTLKLYEGYIHCSGLQYYMPFTENYIKR